MIVGLGIDVVELARIQKILCRASDRFLVRVLCPEEAAAMPLLWKDPENKIPSPAAVAYTAGRFAAKEAVVKALGTGFSQGIGCLDVMILSNASGAPQAKLRGQAARMMRGLGADVLHVSLSHGRETAVAVAILEKTASLSKV